MCNLYLVQNSPAVKIVCNPQECCCEKIIKSKVAAKKWEYGKPGTPEQPGSAGTDKFLRRGHVQAAIIQTIKQDKPLSNYFTVLKH